MGLIKLQGELQELAQKAATTRSQNVRLTALIGILPVVQSLIQSMTDAKVELSFKLDGEEAVPQSFPARPTPAIHGGEALVVNDEGGYQEVPVEADNYQLPRPVLAAMSTLEAIVRSHHLHMVTAVCGYSEKRQKWTGSVLHHHTPESIPYLAAGLRDSLNRLPKSAEGEV